MKKVFFALSMLATVLVLTSCNQKNRDREATVEEITVTTIDDIDDFNGRIVKDSVVDRNGNIMYLTFNNPRGLVDIILKGDTITLSQDTMASGIKFSNAEYVYQEWHGEITLKKDGKIVFEK